jgi:hypothetical protein
MSGILNEPTGMWKLRGLPKMNKKLLFRRSGLWTIFALSRMGIFNLNTTNSTFFPVILQAHESFYN